MFVEVPPSYATLQQAICRIYRLGQTHRCLVLLLTTEGTYDQTLQAKAANKMIGQIAGSSNISVSEDEVERWLLDNSGDNGKDATDEEIVGDEVSDREAATLPPVVNPFVQHPQPRLPLTLRDTSTFSCVDHVRWLFQALVAGNMIFTRYGTLKVLARLAGSGIKYETPRSSRS